MTLNRRLFLSAAAASLLPPSIARALDIPADRRTGSVMDVEHVVILTQENRAFDHYFGSLRGVRGFSAADLAALNAKRRSARTFAPYEAP